MVSTGAQSGIAVWCAATGEALGSYGDVGLRFSLQSTDQLLYEFVSPAGVQGLFPSFLRVMKGHELTWPVVIHSGEFLLKDLNGLLYEWTSPASAPIFGKGIDSGWIGVEAVAKIIGVFRLVTSRQRMGLHDNEV